MNWNFIKPILIFIPLAALQLVVAPIISVLNTIPNFIIILIVFYSLLYGQIFGTILGFLLGGIFDLISGGMLGAYMLSFTVSAFIAGYFYNVNKRDTNTSTFAFVFIVFLCGSINSFLFSAVSISSVDTSLIYLLVEEGILPAIYTAIVSIPVVIFNPRKDLL